MNMSTVTWKYVYPIFPHKCCITGKILWGRKHYKTSYYYYSKYTSAICISTKWIADTEGTQLMLSGEMHTRIMKDEW